jgi:hypothetical protein
MVHDENTYLDDEGLPYVNSAEGGEDESSVPMDGAADGRKFGYGEDAWGGWYATE